MGGYGVWNSGRLSGNELNELNNIVAGLPSVTQTVSCPSQDPYYDASDNRCYTYPASGPTPCPPAYPYYHPADGKCYVYPVGYTFPPSATSPPAPTATALPAPSSSPTSSGAPAQLSIVQATGPAGLLCGTREPTGSTYIVDGFVAHFTVSGPVGTSVIDLGFGSISVPDWTTAGESFPTRTAGDPPSSPLTYTYGLKFGPPSTVALTLLSGTGETPFTFTVNC